MSVAKVTTAVRALIGLAIAVKLGLLLVYARHMRWVMDEFGQGYWGRYVPLGLYTNVESPKTALPYPLYYAAIQLGGDVGGVLAMWRGMTALAALITVAATALAVQRLYRNTNWTLLSVLALLSFSNFMEHAFRVRNDSFAVMFAMLALAALLSERPRVATFGAGVLAAAAFLCTQKVVYAVAPIALYALARDSFEGGARHALSRVWRFGAGGLAAVALYALGFGGLRAGEVLSAIFIAPFKWSGHVLSAASFPGIEQYVAQTLERNVVPYALCALGGAVALLRPERAARDRCLAIASALITLLVFRHVQPWPYVFVLCMPFLALHAPLILRLVPSRHAELALLGVAALLAPSLTRNFAVLDHDNGAQMRVAREAEAMLGPRDRYFDGVGMLATREIAGDLPWWWWDSPVTATLRDELARGDTAHLDSILAQQPKLFITNYRFKRMADWITPHLTSGTVRISDVIRVSGRAIAPGAEIEFKNMWPGAYHVVGRNGRRSAATLRVDGQPCAVPCAIGTGAHRLAVDSPEHAYVIPADVVPPGPLPVTALPFELYQQVYDF